MGTKLYNWRRQRSRFSYAITAASLAFSLATPFLQPAFANAQARTTQDTTIESIWPSTATPTHSSSGDSNAVELGVKFTPQVSGTANGVRFYKDVTNTGTHVGHLWSATGGQLASVTFTGETASGWQSANFAGPVQLTAGTTYVVSYYAPVGEYSYDSANSSDPGSLGTTYTSASGDLVAPSSANAGGNGVYKYTSSPSGVFPTDTYGSSNYWVDVLFNPGGTVTPPPPPTTTNIYGAGYVPANDSAGDSNSVSLGVQFQSQTSGYISGIRFYKGSGNGGTHVGSLWTAKHTLLAQATFTNETASGWQDVSFSGMVPITANTTYIASYYAPQGHYSYTSGGLTNGITNAPLVALPGSTPGGNGLYSYGLSPVVPINGTTGTDYAVDVDFTTNYVAPTTSPQPTPRSGIQGSGSVLVLTDPNNHFSDNYCKAILQTKGIACASTDTGNLTAASVLTPYHTVILADGAPLTSTQVNLVSTWVNGGGNFIAMRPNDNLDSLLGISARTNGSILPDAYLKVDTTQAPGLGIDGQTLQYHGLADEHALNGARAVAMLYADASTATTYPAVTTQTVGSGTASAWMFDLARSTVYLREGNPGLAGQAATAPGYSGVARVPDRFALGYLDLTKVAVPQADLQVSLLANQIETKAAPVPLKWTFPSYKVNANHPGGLLKAAFILTGDDHASGNSQTLNRFASETAASPAGCSVAAWTCIRSTSYAYAGAFSDSAVKPYTDNGFEVSLHVADGSNCAANWTTQAGLDSLYNTSYNAWQSSYPTISAAHSPLTERFHCYGAWNDYATVAKVEAAHGIGADMNSACYPNSLFNVGPCMYTGSGLPENMADSDGTLTGVNQFATQATDENPTTVDQGALNTLVTNATGSNAYYGYFTVLAHLDDQDISQQTEANVLSVAAANDIPVISGTQAQTFWAGRNATTVSAPTYALSKVSFTVASPVANLLMLQPTQYGTKNITGIKVGTTTVAYTTQTINGVSYAVFPAATAGTYAVTYN